MASKINITIHKVALLLASIIIILFTSNTACAAELASTPRVHDEAELLSTEDVSKLEKLAHSQGKNAEIDIYILTHEDSSSEDPERYIEDFQDELPKSNSVFFLYDVFRGEVFIQGYGSAENYIHTKRIDNILDHMVDDIKAGNYYKAFETYITLTASYMQDDSDLYFGDYYEEEKNDHFLTKLWAQIPISIGIGIVAVAIMAYNSGGKITATSRDYLDTSRPGLIGRRDIYLRTRITKRRKPKQNTSSRSGSGGYRGGVSRGGRSHSSGGRKL